MSLQVGFGATVWARGKLHQELDGIGYYTQALAAHLQPAQVHSTPWGAARQEEMAAKGTR